MIDHSLSPAEDLGSAYNNRGLAYLRKDNYTKALADFDAAIKLDPENAYAHYNHGLANYHLERYDRAIADFDWLLRRDPNDIYSLATVAWREFIMLRIPRPSAISILSCGSPRTANGPMSIAPWRSIT